MITQEIFSTLKYNKTNKKRHIFITDVCTGGAEGVIPHIITKETWLLVSLPVL